MTAPFPFLSTLLLSLLFLSLPLIVLSQLPQPGLPVVINTWAGAFTRGTDAAYAALLRPDTSALDVVELGCAACERSQCDHTVGWGGSPDEQCETTLDAMIMDGQTMKSGAVAALRRVRDAISVARRVLDYTTHTLLAGDQATNFALENGFVAENITSDWSATNCLVRRSAHAGHSAPSHHPRAAFALLTLVLLFPSPLRQNWRASNCQNNFRINVSPDPKTSCGPYKPLPLNSSTPLTPPTSSLSSNRSPYSSSYHDTISLIAIKADGSMAAGTSTNGAGHKIPGRVGDGPITGSGSYVDGEVGGCGSTGDGDVMMRFLPCYQAVESMRRGMTPQAAAEDAVRRMMRKYPAVAAGLVTVNRTGGMGAAASNMGFSYAYRGGSMNATQSVGVAPLPPLDE